MNGAPGILQLRQVTRLFAAEPPVFALREVDLTVDEGDYLSIVGPSGSGKSTMLNILGLLDRPTSGDYCLLGESTAHLSESDRAALRARCIGFVFQSFHLLPQRSVLENVLLATLYSGVPRQQRRSLALEALNKVNLSHRTHALPPTLSGGERQRVAIARAVVSSPRIVLADEPTGNLDSENSGEVLDLFDELHGHGLTLVVITHDPVVSARAGRRVVISDGTLSEIT